MPYTEVNGQRIRFDDSGGEGPPVILSHGFLMDREMFASQVGCKGVVRIEGGTHASNLTHPDEVNGPLLDFLRSL
jgi:pimeloyl-ACP methyl ester carboxylesterase